MERLSDVALDARRTFVDTGCKAVYNVVVWYTLVVDFYRTMGPMSIATALHHVPYTERV